MKKKVQPNLQDFHFQMHKMQGMHCYLHCISARVCFLTEHWEDEIFGRVDLQRALVVVLPLLVLREIGDQSVEILDPGTGPEVQLGVVRDVFGAVRCGGGAAASWTRPAGERRRRHVREETVEPEHRSARAEWGAGGRDGLGGGTQAQLLRSHRDLLLTEYLNVHKNAIKINKHTSLKKWSRPGKYKWDTGTKLYTRYDIYI